MTQPALDTGRETLSLKRGISRVSDGMENINETLSQGFAALQQGLANLQNVAVYLSSANPPEPTARAFYYLTALNILEELVLDQTFDQGQVNSSLKKRRGEKNFFQKRLDKAPQSFRDDFERAFRDFEGSDFSERIARYQEVDRLRRRVLWSFYLLSSDDTSMKQDVDDLAQIQSVEVSPDVEPSDPAAPAKSSFTSRAKGKQS